jgi:hypothetical protein
MHVECQLMVLMVGLNAPALSPPCLYLLGTSLVRILIRASTFLVFHGGAGLLACHDLGSLFMQSVSRSWNGSMCQVTGGSKEYYLVDVDMGVHEIVPLVFLPSFEAEVLDCTCFRL